MEQRTMDFCREEQRNYTLKLLDDDYARSQQLKEQFQTIRKEMDG